MCNLKGGQIPGKIYQYSATNKKILFILDGSESEISVLENYFKKFNRYIFCKNNVVDIEFAIKEIEKSGILIIVVSLCTEEPNDVMVKEFEEAKSIND